MGRIREQSSRTLYSLTRSGRKQLAAEQAKWSHLSLAVGKVLRTA